MQRIRICYVITKANFGGAQSYVYELATNLPKEQYEVTVAVGGTGLLTKKLQDAGIRTVTIPHLARDVSFLNEFRVLRFLRQFFLTEKFDVVHVNSSKIGGLGGLAARLARVPRIIFTAHGWAFHEERSWIAKCAIKLSYWTTMLLVHKTIAVSEAIEARVIRWPFIRNRITVVQNGIKPITFLEHTDARTALTEQFPQLSIHTHWIGTIAELHHIKGLDILIDAIAHIASYVPRHQFVIMGEGDARKALEAKIAAQDLTDRVILLGHVDHAATYLRAFDVFILPSRSEALGLALLEAGLAGVPVISTRVGGIPEIVLDDTYGTLVPPNDAAALAAAIRRTLQDTTLHERSTKLKHRVADHFTQERMVHETILMYEQRM